MPELQTSHGSEYNQLSFVGGMNMLLDDTRIGNNQYRLGINVRNRYDRLDLVLSSAKDLQVPPGIIQEAITFGEYQVLFVSGKAYYKHYTINNWTQIVGFDMSPNVPRYWVCAVPLAETNYYRVAASATIGVADVTNSRGAINSVSVAGASAGNLPGLLVQDNILQPRFIFLDNNNIPTCRITQNKDEWSITFTSADNTTVAADGDEREYVPVGNAMAFVNGILYVVSPDKRLIYRAVTGRPLDFGVAVPSTLVTINPYKQVLTFDASQTAYSVGVDDIEVLRELPDGSLFVGAANSNFSVSLNMTQNAPTEFGEYTFIRKFLFNANCLSDRAIFDSVGDTRFIDLTGVRSFNAIEQTQNEGRNSSFTSSIRSAFGSEGNPITQDANYAAAILFNDYELYAVTTIFGPAIAVYDTINSCWVGFDVSQTGGKRIKKFIKIELALQILFAITEDNQIYRLYVGPDTDAGFVRTCGVCATISYGSDNIRIPSPKNEVRPTIVRGILSNITKDCTLSITPYVNSRMSKDSFVKNIKYSDATNPSLSLYKLDDIDKLVYNFMQSVPECEQGWKVFAEIAWSNGSLTQFSLELQDMTPQNPLNSQANDN